MLRLSSRLLSTFCVLASLCASALAQSPLPTPIPLWPNGAPGAKGTEPVDIPEIQIYQPAAGTGNGACMVVFPGGGYVNLSMEHEGQHPAQYLTTLGMTAAVVKYRLGRRYSHPAPLQDAQRAVRYLRSRADELKIDPSRVGVMGFSAGGHLASTISTHFDAGNPESADPVEKLSCKPNFCVLCYPVVTMKDPFVHRGSRQALLGIETDPALVESLSNETQVTDQTPPTFVFHTNADTGVPAENSINYYLALRAKRVPAEMHFYQNGGHGVGMAPGDPTLNSWTTRLADWLRVNEFLSPSQHAPASGTVTFNGGPFRRGTITFIPLNPPTAPYAFTSAGNGRFMFRGNNGPVPGDNQVKIIILDNIAAKFSVKVGDKTFAPGEPVVVKVVPEGNTFAFELKTE